MMTLPWHALSFGIAVVAASTAALSRVTGYGTVLYQNVVLSAWGLVAAVTSERYADLHHGPVWFVALLLNVGVFLVPALMIFFIGRRRRPKVGSVALLVWTASYLLFLFVLFPATDGP